MSFEKMLEKLQQEYIAEIPEKISLIEQHRLQGMDLVKDDFHKLKGSGRTYGLPEISLLGELMEKICVIDHSAVETAVDIALELLRWIHENRRQGRPCEIEKDPRYRDLQKLCPREKAA